MDYKFGYFFNDKKDNVQSFEKIKEVLNDCDTSVRKKILDLKNLNVIDLQKNNLINFHRISPRKWSLLMSNSLDVPFYLPVQRIAIIYLACYAEKELTSLYLFETILNVSKGTAISDIKKLRKFLREHKIVLDYSRKQGFTLDGQEQIIRKVAHDFIVQLMENKSGRYSLFLLLSSNNISIYSKIRDIIAEAIQLENLSVVDGRMDEVIFFLGLSSNRIGVKNISDFKVSPIIKKTRTYKAGEYICSRITSTKKFKNRIIEYTYASEVIMTAIKGNAQDQALDIFFKYSAQIIHHMEVFAAVEFSDYSNLLINLFHHLVPAYFRIDLNFNVSNSITVAIKKQYKEIFNMIRMSLGSFEKFVGKEVPDEELSYITILFGGEIYKEKINQKNIKPEAIILDSNGTSSAILLKTELKDMFPNMNFKLVESIGEFLEENSRNTFDVVFSTTNLDIKQQNVFTVKPIMSPLDKNDLITRVQNKILLPGAKILPANEIVRALRPYIYIKPGVKEQDIYKVINKKINKKLRLEEDDRPMLKDLLTPQMIQVMEGNMNWEESIATAAQPLLDQSAIEPQYIDAMINKVKKYGPFINIGEGIALPHARPEEGSKEVGVSVLKTNKPILLLNDENHPIQLFICLSTVGSSSHLKALAELTDILSNKEKVKELLEADTEEEIFKILVNKEK